MNSFKIIFFLLILFQTLTAQTFEVSGSITDSLTGRPLSFANIRVLENFSGSAANAYGQYSIKLKSGRYKLIASYIGYNSDTISVNVNKNIRVNFVLSPSTIELREVTVLPGVNPAVSVIENAIKRKHERDELLSSYIFDAFTKGKILTTEEITNEKEGVGIDLGKTGSSELKISGIIENQSKGYFLYPGNYKEVIVARKQTANIPSAFNLLTGGRIIQNFYSDDIEFFRQYLTGPLADNALEYYYYYIEDTLGIDNKNVFQIYFSTIDNNAPGFYGRIFITDKTYDLLKVDINLNAAANPGGLFTRVNIFQQFAEYENNIYMPIDYRLFAEGNYLGLLRFGFEVNSILYNYEINPPLSKKDFGKLVLKVNPDADDKDLSYWLNIPTIPATEQELEAYRRIDSLESQKKTFGNRFSPLAGTLYLNDQFYFSGPIRMYHFNRVEGHSIDLSFGLRNLFNERFNSELNLSYGFSDEKLKKEISLNYLLGDFRTTSLELRLFDKTNVFFYESDKYNLFASTLTSLFGKYDFRDYYNSSGFNFDAAAEILPSIKMHIGFVNRTDKSLTNNSDYSFFAKEKSYSKNLLIYDTKINALKFGFNFDFRPYIEDAKFRYRIGERRSRINFGGEALFSNSSLFGSEMDFQIYNFNVASRINSFASTFFDFDLEGNFSNDAVPFQMMKALPGNFESTGKRNSFRTLKLGEIYGDRVITAFFEYNIRDELWRWLNIPFLEDKQILLTVYLNGAFVDISESSKSILQYDYRLFKNPFWESGFSIGHPLIPIQLEFTWKLNHRVDNNFAFGINAFLF